MPERFSDSYRSVMVIASQEAVRHAHEYIGTEHLLLALIKESTGIAAKALRQLSCDVTRVIAQMEKIMLKGTGSPQAGQLLLTPFVRRAINHAAEEARTMQHDYVGTGHLLLALLGDDCNVAYQLLTNSGVSFDATRAAITELSRTERE